MRVGYVVAQQHRSDLHLLPGLQAVAPRILIPGFGHLLDVPDNFIDVVIAQFRGRPMLLQY